MHKHIEIGTLLQHEGLRHFSVLALICSVHLLHAQRHALLFTFYMLVFPDYFAIQNRRPFVATLNLCFP